MGASSRWIRHFRALLVKNWWVAQSWWISFVGLVALPLLLLTLLPIIISIKDASQRDKDPFEDTTPFSVELDRCVPLDAFDLDSSAASPCVSVLYAPSVDPYDTVMQNALAGTEIDDARGFVSERSMLEAVAERGGGVLLAIAFRDNGTASDGTWDYRVYVNDSAPDTSALKTRGFTTVQGVGTAIALQLALNRAIVRHIAGDGRGTLDVRFHPIEGVSQDVDTDTHRSGNRHDDVVRIGGNIAIAMGLVLSTLMAAHLVAAEKHAKLLGAMRVMGLQEGAYWVSWLATFGIVSLVIAIVLPLLGLCFGLRVFEEVSYLAHFLALFLFCMASFAMGLFVASFTSRPRWVNVAAFVIILMAAIVTPLMSDGGGDFVANPDTTTIALIITFPMPFCWYSWLFGVFLNASARDGDTFSFVDFRDTVGHTGRSADFGLWMLLVWTIAYTLLAWYCSQVFSSQLGAAQVYWFPFTSEYWGLGRGEGRVVEGDTVTYEKLRSRDGGTIRTVKVSKSYKTTTALREVTLELHPQEIFALLGHNGAGKSTLVNILACLTLPTYGNAFVRGLDVRRSQREIQHQLGVCHQEDLLWPNLTSRDHLLLFGTLRGLDPSALPDMIVEKLRDFDLGDMIDSRVASMSGGMKRRLSLSIATIGDPPVVFLDEPSSGLDPLTRHRLWQSIRALKRQSLVVLTTHSMEEADALGDRVGILANGRLRALGTTLFLKQKFGSGYQLQLHVDTPNVPRIQQLVAEHMPGAELVSQAAGSVTIGMPKSALPGVSYLFKALADEESGEGELVKDWSFSNSTLEEVFLRLTSSDFEVNAGSGTAALDVCALCRQRAPDTVTLFTKRGQAVRVSGLVCSECGYVDGDAGVGDDVEAVLGKGDDDKALADEDQSVVQSGPPREEQQTILSENIEMMEKDARIQNYIPGGKPSPFVQTRAILLKNLALLRTTGRMVWIVKLLIVLVAVLTLYFGGGAHVTGGPPPNGLPEPDEYADAALFDPYPVLSHMSDTCYYPTGSDEAVCRNRARFAPDPWLSARLPYRDATASGSSPLSAYDPFGLGIGVLVARRHDPTLESPSPTDPLYTIELKQSVSPAADARDGQNALANNHTIPGNPNNDRDFCAARELLSERLPSATLVVTRSNVATADLAVDLGLWSDGFGYARDTVGVDFEECSECYVLGAAGGYTYDSHAGNNIAFLTNMLVRTLQANATIASSFASLPFIPYRTADYTEIATQLQWLTIASLLQFPAVPQRVVGERHGGLVAAMRVSGLRIVIYWVANALFDYFLIALWNFALLVLLAIFQVDAVTFGGFANWLVTLVILWPLAQLGMGYCIAAAVTKPSTAAITSYTGLLVSVGLALTGALLKPGTYKEWLAIFAPIAYGRAAGGLMRYGDSLSVENVPTLWGILFGISLAYLVVAVAVNVTRLLPGLCGIERNNGAKLYLTRTCVRQSDDLDVEAERQRVDADFDELVASGGIVVRDLHKVYPLGGGAYKHAVAGLSLAVEPGTVCALLGPNGSGKTTLLHTLTGIHRPTAGCACVAGHDVVVDMGEVYARIGFVPQFDALFPELTVRDHLLFYSRLKGVSRTHEKALVQYVAEEVVLDGDPLDKIAGSLSGGMRRKLSLGVSLCGNVDILIVDEPSTGLSPDARRDMWRILKRQGRRGRSIIISTHSMSEAEVLGTRIVIMNEGRLIVVGPQPRLKRRFGDGYHLTLGLEHLPTNNDLERLYRYVRRALCAKAHRGVVSGTSVGFVFPNDAEDDVLGLFDKMERNRTAMREHLGVMEWSVAMASLEGVFIKTVTDDQQAGGAAGLAPDDDPNCTLELIEV